MAAPKHPKAQGSKPDKLWRDEINKAVHELREAEGEGKAKKVKALRLLARKLVTKGLAGDVTALKEIGDRLDGRAVQGVEFGGPGGGAVKVEVSIKEAARLMLALLREAQENQE